MTSCVVAQLSHPDVSLANSRFGSSHQSAWTLLTLLLPGAVVTLQGEELDLPLLPLESLPKRIQQLVRNNPSTNKNIKKILAII